VTTAKTPITPENLIYNASQAIWMSENYYDAIASGYDELHEAEQLKKLEIVKKELNIKKETKLLDVGCGSGISSQFDCDITGIDPSEELLKIAEQRLPAAQFIQGSAEQLPFEDKSFDVVISLTAIQNFTDLEKGIQEIKRVGKKQFALSYLKKSEKAELIENTIKKYFPKSKTIDEDKDIIHVIKE
jgi:ubiquinone/menaquinone biosynthesis C-methylase UbiE